MTLRSTIFWIHAGAALCVGAVIVVMSVTGVLLAWQRQITDRADHLGIQTSAEERDRLPVDSIIAYAEAAANARATSVIVRSDVAKPTRVMFGRERMLLLDPATGTVLGTGSARVRTFFRTVEDVHRWLALSDDRLRFGRAVTGAANIVFAIIVLTGTVLWWPRRLSWASFRTGLLPGRGLRPRARNFSWHRAAGIWSAFPLIVIIATGAVTSYAWAGRLLERGSPAAPSMSVAIRPDTSHAPLLSLNDLMRIAAAHEDDWREIALRLPPRDERFTFVIDRGTGGQPQRRTEIVLARDGQLLQQTRFEDRDPADRAREIARYTHTGEILGLVGQTVAALASAAAIFLFWTGASLALARFAAWRRRPSHASGTKTSAPRGPPPGT